MKQIWLKLKWSITRIHHYKYWIVGGIFLILISFFDENNLVKRFENERRIHHLEDEIQNYQKIVQNNLEKINELKTNNANLEKFARETYGMKKTNEDVYIIKEK